jgi:hypothetical protein
MRQAKLTGHARELTDIRGKKTGRVLVQVCGIEGYGNTIDEAEGCVAEYIRRLDEHSPVIVRHKSIVAMMYPCRECWYYSIAGETIDTRNPIQNFGCSSLESTYEKSLDKLLLILAQRGWEPQDRQTIPVWMNYPDMIREWLSWTEFQLRFVDARQRGLSDDDCHAYAGRNPARRDLWAHETTAA